MTDGGRSILERLRRGEWPSLENALVVLLVSSPLSKAATNFALAACIVLFVRDWRRGLIHPRATPLDGVFAGWVFACLLSGLTSIEPLESFRDLRSLGHWSVFYILAWGVAGGASLGRLQNAWLVAGALCAGHALLQALGIDLRGRPLAIPRGFFGGHLELGHYMVVLLALAIARAAFAASVRERQVLFAALAAFGAALVLSGGRGPWLAFVAVGVAWTLFRHSRVALAGLALVVVLQVVFLARQPEGLRAFYGSYVTFARDEPLPEVSEERLASNLWRLWMWREGLRRFALRPLSGTGVETTGELSLDFRTPYADLAVAHLHSNYFEILMTRGFFGLTAFLWLLLTAGRAMRVAMNDARDGESAGAYFTAFAAVLAHLVHGLTQFTFGASWIQIGFYVALGLGFGQAMKNRGLATESLARGDVVWAVAAATIAFWMSPILVAHPWLTTSLATVAALDLLARLASGRASPLAQALLGGFAFVVIAATVLLGYGAGFRLDVAPIVLAAGVPFALLWLAWSASDVAKWLKAI